MTVAWRLANLSDLPVQIQESWLPHSQFFAERLRYTPPLHLAAGVRLLIRRNVRCDPDRGSVENAFLNLRVHYGHQTWRVLVRMRVGWTAKQLARPVVEAVTLHQVGFAAVEV